MCVWIGKMFKGQRDTWNNMEMFLQVIVNEFLALVVLERLLINVFVCNRIIPLHTNSDCTDKSNRKGSCGSSWSHFSFVGLPTEPVLNQRHM